MTELRSCHARGTQESIGQPVCMTTAPEEELRTFIVQPLTRTRCSPLPRLVARSPRAPPSSCQGGKCAYRFDRSSAQLRVPQNGSLNAVPHN
ncbi:UNVERIFIED_CONTAM: hypothetical protein HHA_453520 [Hammondia hammondi]|eukprot:XP_008886772.1 hypothetical protein HHA_453520 [Hammondia hammondi]